MLLFKLYSYLTMSFKNYVSTKFILFKGNNNPLILCLTLPFLR